MKYKYSTDVSKMELYGSFPQAQKDVPESSVSLLCPNKFSVAQTKFKPLDTCRALKLPIQIILYSI